MLHTSKNTTTLHSLPDELLTVILKYAISGGQSVNPSELEDPFSRRFQKATWLRDEFIHVSAACRYRQWTLSLRLVSRVVNAILEPLVFDHLTFSMTHLISQCEYMSQMLDDIASKRDSPLARYPRSLFLGSVYDQRTVRLHPNITYEYEETLRAKFASTPSDPNLFKPRWPKTEADRLQVDLRDHAPGLAHNLQKAIGRMINLKTFKWNVRSEGSYALLSGAIISGLALLPSLSYATFGCMDQYLEVPKSLPSISTVHTLSLHIHTIGAQPDPEFLSYTMGDLASLVPMFPGIENLSIRCCDNVVFGFDTTKNIVQQALSGYLPQLKTLDLLNVPAELMFDELTTPRFTQLQTLGVFFSQPPFEPDTRLGSLPVVDKDGSTNLQSLTIHSERDGSPFHIIPRSGLRHLSLIGSLLDEDLDGMGVSFSERLDLVLSGHRKTLESLVLLPSCYVDDAWYENTMRPTLSECTQLKHFAIGVEGTFKSIVRTVIDSISDLRRPLCTLAIDVLLGREDDINTYFEQIESMFATGAIRAPPRYPRFINLTVVRGSVLEHVSRSYQLKQLILGWWQYTVMNSEEVQDVISTLPGGLRSGLWGDRYRVRPLFMDDDDDSEDE